MPGISIAMERKRGKILIALVILLVAALSLSFKLSDIRKPDESQHASYSADHLEHLEDFGLLLRLPEGWEVVSTTQSALTLNNEKGEQTYILIEPEGYFYHNPAADILEDYASSYRGLDIDVVVGSSEPIEVDGEPALFQVYRAGDLVDGELDSTSLASIPGPSHRYVLRHPSSGKFFIISYSGVGDPEVLHRIVGGLRFEKD